MNDMEIICNPYLWCVEWFFDVLNGYADRGQKGTSYYMPELYIDLSTN